MRCLVCHRMMHDNPKDWVIHHRNWPKKPWQKRHKGERNPTYKVHQKCEKDYHAYFWRFCFCVESDCRRCRFVSICCYYKSETNSVIPKGGG